MVHCYQPVIKVTGLSLFPISNRKKLRSWIGCMSANVFEAPVWHFRDVLTCSGWWLVRCLCLQQQFGEECVIFVLQHNGVVPS